MQKFHPRDYKELLKKEEAILEKRKKCKEEMIKNEIKGPARSQCTIVESFAKDKKKVVSIMN